MTPLDPRIVRLLAWNDEGCWVWTGARNPHGYGQYSRSVNGQRIERRVHRTVYEALVGPIPEGLEIDHLCRNRACANPAHLEPVTHRENLRRAAAIRYGDVCSRGHARTPENTYRRPDTGTGQCRPCIQVRERQRRKAA